MIKNSLINLFYIFALFTLFTSIAYSQISPGDLTTAHANLEGLSNCTKCHELGDQVENDKCLSCHTEIDLLIREKSGYHASGEVKSKNCWDCHSEHHGRNFRIINFNPVSFNHNKAGYKLEGAHTKIDCDKCHQSKNILDTEIKKRKGTYLGLNSNCFSCHDDFHQTTLGDNCAACHNTTAFRPSVNFNHNEAKFKLTGSHKNVKCEKCHRTEKRNGKDFQVFKGINFSGCQSCHKDAHQGKFGEKCSGCHNTISFNKINQGSFNHSKTNFPLVGKHGSVSCKSCHKQNLKIKLNHEKCTDCHSDYHNAQFVKDETITDCSECHNEFGFHPSLFSIEQHSQTKFALAGAHLATPCENCHQKEEKWSFRNIGLICSDCHNNIHKDELKEKYLPENKCDECHQVDTWASINFDHNKTEFALLGKHLNQNCNACHVKIKNQVRQIFFSSLKAECGSCHNDVHNGQFKNESGVSDCSRCHSFDNWKPDNFNHETTAFPLKGAHKNVDCSKCHPKEKMNETIFIKFKLESFKCADCHT